MAEYLSSIFGTEKDKVNCPFYFKIGACTHGDKCKRRHNKPTMSQTLLLTGMYQNPVLQPGFDPKRAQEQFDDFYEDIWEELSTYGEIEELNVCDNLCAHLLGNVYVKYYDEESAERAIKALTGRFYGGKAVVAEYSPVTDFREGSCRQFEKNECVRGSSCNFMHLKTVSRDLLRRLWKRGSRKRKSKSRSPRRDEKRRRSKSPRDRERGDRDRERGDRDRDRERDRSDRDRTDRERDRSDRGGERRDNSRGENQGEGYPPQPYSREPWQPLPSSKDVHNE